MYFSYNLATPSGYMKNYKTHRQKAFHSFDKVQAVNIGFKSNLIPFLMIVFHWSDLTLE